MNLKHLSFLDCDSSAKNTTFVQQKVVSTLRTARLPADMVAVEQDSTSTTDSLIAAEQQKHAKMKELEVSHSFFCIRVNCFYDM